MSVLEFFFCHIHWTDLSHICTPFLKGKFQVRKVQEVLYTVRIKKELVWYDNRQRKSSSCLMSLKLNTNLTSMFIKHMFLLWAYCIEAILLQNLPNMNYFLTCTSRLVLQHSCQVSFKSMQYSRSCKDKLKCVKKKKSRCQELLQNLSNMNYLPKCTSRLVVQHSCHISVKSMQQCRRSWEELDMCLWNMEAPGGNKVKIWQKSASPTFWPHPTPGACDVSEVWGTHRVQVWWLYHHRNFKYCTLFVSGTELRTDKRTNRQTDDPITRCPGGPFRPGA